MGRTQGYCSPAGRNSLPLLFVMFEDFVSFIANNYAAAKKIVEIGVGHRIDVAVAVKARLPGAEIVVTDKDESWIRTRSARGVRMVVDDVASPRLAVYAGSGLVYSLHPPVELIQSLVILAGKVGADLLVLPVMDEQEAFHGAAWKRVTDRGRTVGWLLPRPKLEPRSR